MTDQSTVTAGLKYLAAEFSCEADEFERDNPSNAMLLDGLVSRGYAKRDRVNGRYAITEQGRTKLAAEQVSA